MSTRRYKKDVIEVAELFAGVGGFRLALDGYHSEGRPEFERESAGPFKTVWANQWEPPGTESKQFAWRCYEERFGSGSCVNEDINKVLDAYEAGTMNIPDFEMLVGGFPCQDYSVAKPLKVAGGIEGKKGVLWWDIYRMIKLKKPRYLLLENVDRLLKSPASQRGRDFAIMLSCLSDLGYAVEWRVINAADYGMPQRRRRVFIFGEKTTRKWNLKNRLSKNGVIVDAFPIAPNPVYSDPIEICNDPYEVSQNFGCDLKVSPFANAGVMQYGVVQMAKVEPKFSGAPAILGDIAVPDSEVPERFFVADEKVEKWDYLKGAKSEPRTTKAGFTYHYSEGPVAFPDSLEKPARTILTSEGGSGASRTKHIIIGDSGRLRRLVPDELDQIQMFPRGWTDGMSDGHRAFCMGNALVVGIPHEIGKAIARKRFKTSPSNGEGSQSGQQNS